MSETMADRAPEQDRPEGWVADAAPAPRGDAWGLCLSGGGFRATLFHLGVLRRLNELGLLTRMAVVSSVSGGSIANAQLAEAIAEGGAEPGRPIAEFDARVARPLYRLTARNIRTWPVIKSFFQLDLLFMRGATIRAIQAILGQRLTGRALRDLPAAPRFVFCATDMSFGVMWVSERARAGSYKAGYLDPAADPQGWTVARAVAASACFPPVFLPMRLKLDPEQLHGRYTAVRATEDSGGLDPDIYAGLVRKMRLSDGGVYENLGIQPLLSDRSIGGMIISDGGSALDYTAVDAFSKFLMRIPTVLMSQVGALRKRNAVRSFQDNTLRGGYLGIQSAPSSYPCYDHIADEAEVPGYSKWLARNFISNVRTDLDSFTDAERAVLENHGYELAQAMLHSHCPELLATAVDAPAVPPHPAYQDAEVARRALERSGRRLLGRPAPALPLIDHDRIRPQFTREECRRRVAPVAAAADAAAAAGAEPPLA